MDGRIQRLRRAARFPAGRVGYAVGDIHGRVDLLVAMIAKLESLAARDRTKPVVVFLGDYVDRGPDSAGVLALLVAGRPAGFERRFLCGNHDYALQAFLQDPVRAQAWLRHGGAETLASYGIDIPAPGLGEEGLRETARALSAMMPQTHKAFLAGLERYVVFGDYLFVHAGVDPERSIEMQYDHDLFGIRGKFLEDDRAYSHIVVHGHTPVPAPFQDHRRIALDTKAYASGTLSAARFENEVARSIVVTL